MDRRPLDDRLLEHLRQWGPAPYKITWTELCQRECQADILKAREVAADGRVFMSRQIVGFNRINNGQGGRRTDYISKKVLSQLRPEDAVHIPLLRVDRAGIIWDWNRSMCDLTGVSAQQVVGKTYADVLEEWLPHLSEEYKQAAVDWLRKNRKEEMKTSAYSGEECREDYLFPLPLPLRYDPSFKYASGRCMHHNEYVELLVARVDNLPAVYPKFHSDNGVPQYGKYGEDKVGWFFNTRGWVGGVEFTLRRKQFLPSLQALCRELLPGNVVDEHGTLDIAVAATAAAASSSEDVAAASSLTTSQSGGKEDHYETISNFIRACGRVGMKYILDVLSVVRRATRTDGKIKVFPFSEDWSTSPSTVEIHKTVLLALGGSDVIGQSVDKGKLSWSFGSKNSKMDKEARKEASRRRNDFNNRGRKFLTFIAPVITENEEHARSLCRASDSSMTMDDPNRTLLTLKIEGIERSDGYCEEEKFKDWAVVQVPATLNFFQLHRVVCQTMNCAPDATRETHEWKAPITVCDYCRGERAITDDKCNHVQLGETYMVEDGCREDYGCFDDVLFDQGAALRQRISRTGAYFDQTLPLFSDNENPYYRRLRGERVDKIVACIHSTCISAVFFQPGALALLQNGLIRYCAKFKLTCLKCEEFTGPLPANPNINAMQPKCLRGKAESNYDAWSVAKANKQLERDRGCLRRIMCGTGPNTMTQMPWCRQTMRPVNKDSHRDDSSAPFPFAVQLKGIDNRPMFLFGEPPLPGSEEYESYVSTLDGRIDPELRQERIVAGGSFSVPFRYGSYCSWDSYTSDDSGSESSGDGKCIGKVWTQEVDEEMKRFESLQPKKKSRAKGKKKKAGGNESGTKCGKRPFASSSSANIYEADTDDDNGKPAALKRDALQGDRLAKMQKTNRQIGESLDTQPQTTEQAD